jgi:hypothetical protein
MRRSAELERLRLARRRSSRVNEQSEPAEATITDVRSLQGPLGCIPLTRWSSASLGLYVTRFCFVSLLYCVLIYVYSK